MSAKTYHVSIPPCTQLIQAMIDAEDMSLKKAFAELVVNSIDHHSENIALNYNVAKGEVTIVDDGDGPPQGLEKLAEIGRHIASKKAPVGRFGVGNKDAVCWLANIADMYSMRRSDDFRQRLHIDWQHMMEIEDWDFVFAHESPRASHGLSILLKELRPRRMKSWSELPRYISELFSAAIDAGVVITVDGETVKSIPVPELDFRFEFGGNFNGLEFKGFAGLLKGKGAAPSGWDVRYGPQSIATGYTKEGFGSSISPQGFYGRFEMLAGSRAWHLTRNKTNSEDLYDVLNCEYMQRQVILPLLKRLKERGETLKIRLNQQLVTTSITNLLRKAKVRIEEEKEETITAPKKDGPIIGLYGRGGGRKPPGPNPGPGPKPVPSEELPRKKRVHDDLSTIKDRIKEVQAVHFWPQGAFETKNRGFFFLDMIERGTQMRIFIDESTPFGIRLWQNGELLLHYAVMCLSSYLSLGIDIRGQLRLPIGDPGDPSERKVSKALTYLLDNVELDEFFSANGNGKEQKRNDVQP